MPVNIPACTLNNQKKSKSQRHKESFQKVLVLKFADEVRKSSTTGP